jgi:hypothetical protein
VTPPKLTCNTPGCENPPRAYRARYCSVCVARHAADRRAYRSRAATVHCARCGDEFIRSGNCIYCAVCRALPPAYVDLSRYAVNPPEQLDDGSWVRMCKICSQVLPWDMAHFRQNKASAPGTVCVHCRDDETSDFRQARREVNRQAPPRVVVEYAPPKPRRIIFFGESSGRAISDPGEGWRARREL